MERVIRKLFENRNKPVREGWTPRDDYVETVEDLFSNGVAQDLDVDTLEHLFNDSSVDVFSCYYYGEDMFCNPDSNTEDFNRLEALTREGKVSEEVQGSDGASYAKVVAKDGTVFIRSNSYGYISYFVAP